MKKISKTNTRKLMVERNYSIEIYNTADEDKIYVEVKFEDGNKVVIEIAKYISLENSAEMIYKMASELAGEQEVDGETQYLYRPYMKGWLSCFFFLNYFTNVDVAYVNPEVLNKFFLTSKIWKRIVEEVWGDISEGKEGLPQLMSIMLAVDEMVEYNNQYYINTQTQRIKALEMELNSALAGISDLAFTFSNVDESYAGMSREDTEKLVGSINKIAEIDPNQFAEKVGAYVVANKDVPKPKRGRTKKITKIEDITD